MLVPLALKSNDFLDSDRVVLYREDCREIPYVMREGGDGSISPKQRSIDGLAQDSKDSI